MSLRNLGITYVKHLLCQNSKSGLPRSLKIFILCLSMILLEIHYVKNSRKNLTDMKNLFLCLIRKGTTLILEKLLTLNKIQMQKFQN